MVHNLRIPVTEAYGPGEPIRARARAGYTLLADRGFPVKAVPARYALAADMAIPERPAPPEHALAVDKHAGRAETKPGRTSYGSLATALVLHLAILLPIFGYSNPARRLGTEQGLPQTLNVSVISAADLKRLSSAPAEQEAPPFQPPAPAPPAPPPVTPPVPAPPQPAAEQTIAAFYPPQPKANETRDGHDAPFDAASFADMASRQFSAQLDYSFKAAEAQRNAQRQAAARPAARAAAPNVKVMRPGATHIGKSDEFERAVIWALGATVPTGNGKWGSSVVTFVVSASGQVEDLRLVKSAGDDWLDHGALMAVRQARMPAPPPGLPVGDRRFVIEYISLPFRTR